MPLEKGGFWSGADQRLVGGRLNNWLRYILIFIKRDLSSFGGGRSFGEFFFQGLLPIIGSVLMLSALCATGIVVLGFFDGYRAHLEDLEGDPSSSAIRLEGHFSNRDTKKLDFENLVWNREMNLFRWGAGKNDDEIKIVRFVSPYRQRGLFCVDRNGYLSEADVFWGTTVKVSDANTKRSVVNSFVLPGRYFDSDDDQGLIISLSLYRALGYGEEEPMPPFIRVIAPNVVNLPYDRINGIPGAKPFTEKKELAEFTVVIPLIGVARTLPDGSFIMTEGLFWNLQENKGIYDKSRPVAGFSIEFKGDASPLQKAVNQWIATSFGNRILKDAPTITKNMGKKSIVVTFKSVHELEKEKGAGEGNGALPTAGAVEASFYRFFEPLSMDIALNLGQPKEYRGEIETYNGMMLFLINVPEIFNNIDKLYFFFKKQNIYANTHQMETIKKYRQDMNLISSLIPLILGSCILLIVLYVLVSFTLFVQNKRHKIGVMLAMGVTSNMARFVYLIETSVLFCGSFLLALFISAVVSTYLIEDNWPFAFAVMSNLGFFLSALFMADLAGLLAVRHTLNKMPLNLIAFRE